MNAWLTLDFVAKRYGILPSELLESGSSIDAKCAVLAVEYETYLTQKAHAKANGEPEPNNITTEEMAAMLAATRSKHEAKVSAKNQQNSAQTKP